jgi:hypothetical protein
LRAIALSFDFLVIARYIAWSQEPHFLLDHTFWWKIVMRSAIFVAKLFRPTCTSIPSGAIYRYACPCWNMTGFLAPLVIDMNRVQAQVFWLDVVMDLATFALITLTGTIPRVIPLDWMA